MGWLLSTGSPRAAPVARSPDVRAFPAERSPPVLRPLLTPARSASASQPRPSSRTTLCRSPRIRTITFPLPPPRLRDAPLGDDGLRRVRPAHPERPASYAVRVPRCRGSASGFLPTPPHG